MVRLVKKENNLTKKRRMSTTSTRAETLRWRLEVNGIVQGVGFRPFVYRTARKYNLTGYVVNNSNGVEIEIQGLLDATDGFLRELTANLPPLAEITELKKEQIHVDENDTSFSIRASRQEQKVRTLISPDIATCDDCLSELSDPEDRRYQYPFINCTNCGPRFTIIESIPYDRPSTTMSSFLMCDKCLAEYEDPSNRRFHAQPNACPACGPHIWLESMDGDLKITQGNEVIEHSINLLLQGKTLAIKGLGGFHLAVLATDADAVSRLRMNKNREEKPLAVMVADIKTATKITKIDSEELRLLRGIQRPIVLLRKKESTGIAATIAPGNQRLGLMLPYTPLHHLLFRQLSNKTDPAVLVMTSANLSEEPIVISNEESRQRLKGIADYILMHNRDILIRSDDSVMMQIDGKQTFIRRSRGYVPKPVNITVSGPEVLAVGAHLKNTICILKEDQAFLSQHIGDLENLEAFMFFKDTISHMNMILETAPEIIAHDLHPEYLSTKWAVSQGDFTRTGIQHHHAHMASVMSEWHLKDPVIGIILDGTGYGYDRTIWGGEVLTGDLTEIRRFAHLETMAVPGGESAIQHPWKMALALLHKTFGNAMPGLPFLKGKPFEPVLEIIKKGIHCPKTSSCGRLFDAVSAICGIRTDIRYEAQAAIELMQHSFGRTDKEYTFDIRDSEIVVQPMIREIVRDVIEGKQVAEIGSAFHNTLIKSFLTTALQARKRFGINKVVLSGGSFQNEILHSGFMMTLTKNNFKVYCQKQVPANDGGIALGQAVIARELYKRGLREVSVLS